MFIYKGIEDWPKYCTQWRVPYVGDRVNIERSMIMNGRLDGHIVQGHVDKTAKCVNMEDADGSTYFTFEYPCNREMAQRGYFTVDKGSVTVWLFANQQITALR